MEVEARKAYYWVHAFKAYPEPSTADSSLADELHIAIFIWTRYSYHGNMLFWKLLNDLSKTLFVLL